MMTDPIADMLTRIRNSNDAKHEVVSMPGSKIKHEIANILLEEGYVTSVDFKEDNKQGTLNINLKYGPNNEKVISGIKRISKPGLKVYVKATEVPKVLGGLGIAMISTSQGIMTDRQARDQGIGGEVICYIW